MQKHAVPVAQLVFPVLLPFSERMFFEHFVSIDDKHGSCRFKPYPALDADNGIADVHIAPYTVFVGNILQHVDKVDFIFRIFSVYRNDFPFFKTNTNGFFTRFHHLARVSAFGQRLFRFERFLTTDTCSPKSLVDGIFHFFEVSRVTVFFQITDFILTCQSHIACRSKYLNFRS